MTKIDTQLTATPAVCPLPFCPLVHSRRNNSIAVPSRSGAASAALAGFLMIWFFSRAWRGLTIFFSGDDIMNMYWSCEMSWVRLLISNLTPFTTAYRPLGAAVYRIMYEVFGLNPLPFRVLVYGLLLVNLYLCFRLARALAGSWEIGALAALLAAFHNRLADLYLNNGTLYDVLCGTFYLAAVLHYVRLRQRGRDLSGWQWMALFAFEIAALNAKEVGVTIPLVLIAYEITFHGMRRLIKRWVGVAIVLGIAILAARARFQPGSRLIHNEGYRLDLSLHRFLETSGKLYGNLFHMSADATPLLTGAIVLLLLTLVMASKSSTLRFCALFILITPLPVNFIPARELYATYIPVFGWAILLGSILVRGRDWMYTTVWRRPALPSGTIEPERVFLALTVAAFLLLVQTKDRSIPWEDARCPKNNVCNFYRDIRAIQPSISSSNSILLLSDGFDKEDWTPILLCRLIYHRLDMEVDRVSLMSQPPDPAARAKYSRVLRYQNGHLITESQSPYDE